MEITATAPNRIDLAGGTTDIYPLYLFMEGGCTVNIAITVSSRVTVTRLSGAQIRLISQDLGMQQEASSPAELSLAGPLGLLARVVQALVPEGGVELHAQNQAPPGSGLGASSALLVAAIRALLAWRGKQLSPAEIVRLAANIETATIGVPTGTQDYIAAMYGGVSLIKFDYGDFSRRAAPSSSNGTAGLPYEIILSYTGKSRFSGMNNWEITKAFIDGDPEVRDKLVRIRDVACEVSRALEEGKWEELPPLVAQEWSLRRMLTPGVSTPRVEAMMEAAIQAGALANKICGAGGGGCMISLVESQNRESVARSLQAAGGTIMPFTIAAEGVTIEQRP